MRECAGTLGDHKFLCVRETKLKISLLQLLYLLQQHGCFDLVTLLFRARNSAL